MDQNTTNPQAPPAQPVVNQQVMPPSTPPVFTIKKLIMILGVVVLVVIIAGIGMKLAPTNRVPTATKITPAQKSGFGDLLRSITKTPETTNTAPGASLSSDRPIILVKSNKIVAIDPENSTKEEIIYEIKDGLFKSAKLSPDGKKLVYASYGYEGYERDLQLGLSGIQVTIPPGGTKCAELGIISLDNKERSIAYSSDNCGDNILLHKQYEWVDSSTLLYYDTAKNNLNLYQYDINTNKSSSKTIAIKANLVRTIREKNIYYQNLIPRDEGSRNTWYKVGIDNTSKIESLFNIDVFNLGELSVSPDEQYAVYAAGVADNGVIFRQLNGNIIKKFTEPDTFLANCARDKIIFSPDSKYVAVCATSQDKNVQYLIFDSTGTKIAELTTDKINSLMPTLPSDVIINNGFINKFDFSPDSKKIFFVYTFFYPIEGGYSLTGFYAFMGDADGKNLKRVPLAVDGVKSYKQGDSNSEKEFKEFSKNSIVDVDW